MKVVDKLEILVLVDNATDSVSSVPGNVRLEWPVLMRAGMRELSGEYQCCANHGLSLIVTAYAGDHRHSVLFDGGPVGYVVELNAARLGVDMGTIEGVVLSHGHWDHAGGLLAALDLIAKGKNGRGVPCYVHPGMFRQRAWPLPNGELLPIKAIPSPSELSAAGATVISTTEPQLFLDDMFYISGEIPRRTAYEKGFPGHSRRTEDGSGWEPDPWIVDERFMAVNVRGKGLLVFTACSHAGVVNVLTHARHLFPDVPLCAVAGGLHLSGRNESIIPNTVEDMKRFALKMIIPGHCTGWRAVNALANAFGDGVVVPSAVGKEFTF
jgi:7,8-dihydropterin-6-yl-methyl-4-(beta-D-ribofuranosyl)aminobenzene 5'-phosphate synthase